MSQMVTPDQVNTRNFLVAKLLMKDICNQASTKQKSIVNFFFKKSDKEIKDPAPLDDTDKKMKAEGVTSKLGKPPSGKKNEKIQSSSTKKGN